jgi:hypothetical protein
MGSRKTKNNLLLLGRSYVAVLVAAGIFIFSFSVRSEPIRPHHFGWRFGAEFPQVREDILTPLRFGGAGAVLGIEYGYISTHHRHLVTADFGISYLQNSYGDPALDLIWDAAYVYMYRIFQSSTFGSLWLGGALRYTMDWQYYLSWDQEHLYWLTTLDLGPSMAWQHLFAGKHDVDVSLEFPVMALASRPPQFRYYKIGRLDDASYHFTKTNEDMKFTSLHEYIAVRFTADYLYRARPNLHFGARYQLGYRTHSEPSRYQRLNNAILFRMVHRFGKTGSAK